MVTRDEVKQADARAKRLRDAGPTAVSAAYDSRTGRIVVRLTSGIDIGFSPHDTQGLETAKPAQLNPIEISPSGLGLHFPKVDPDLYLPALLEGVFGSRRWMAARSEEPKRRSGAPSESSSKKSSSKPSGSSRKSGGPGGRTRKAAAE